MLNYSLQQYFLLLQSDLKPVDEREFKLFANNVCDEIRRDYRQEEWADICTEFLKHVENKAIKAYIITQFLQF